MQGNGNCKCCNARMSYSDSFCPKCHANATECFLSDVKRQENIDAVNQAIYRNLRVSFGETWIGKLLKRFKK